jgi:hypothetical protein
MTPHPNPRYTCPSAQIAIVLLHTELRAGTLATATPALHRQITATS